MYKKRKYRNWVKIFIKKKLTIIQISPNFFFFFLGKQTGMRFHNTSLKLTKKYL